MSDISIRMQYRRCCVICCSSFSSWYWRLGLTLLLYPASVNPSAIPFTCSARLSLFSLGCWSFLSIGKHLLEFCICLCCCRYLVLWLCGINTTVQLVVLVCSSGVVSFKASACLPCYMALVRWVGYYYYSDISQLLLVISVMAYW